MGMGETPTNTSFFRRKWKIKLIINYDTFSKAFLNIFSQFQCSLLLRAINDGKDEGCPIVYGGEIDCGC